MDYGCQFWSAAVALKCLKAKTKRLERMNGIENSSITNQTNS